MTLYDYPDCPFAKKVRIVLAMGLPEEHAHKEDTAKVLVDAVKALQAGGGNTGDPSRLVDAFQRIKRLFEVDIDLIVVDDG